MQRGQAYRFDGLRIPVEIWGRETRPLVFLPGMGVHPAYYHEGLRLLARHFTVFVPDLSFRTHATLPERVATYRAFTEAFCAHYAPEAPRAGHSFGGLIALLGSRPAVALSPTIPVRIGWAAKVGRAALLQLREYFGLEGKRGVRWAWQILRDYARTAVRTPRCLFPAVSETLHGLTQALRPTAPRAHLVLARHDRLYLRREYDAFLATPRAGAYIVRRVDRGHDWPVTDPALLEREVLRATATPRAGR